MTNNKKKRILITGANGFIGSTLTKSIHKEEDIDAFFSIRKKKEMDLFDTSKVFFNEINEQTDWSDSLEGVDAVIHLAARAHILNEGLKDPLKEYIRVNYLGTKNLVNQCIRSGVKKFIYLSSIGVLGRVTTGSPFTDESPLNPVTDYAVSKIKAEEYLRGIDGSNIDIVILRVPLVYGPGVGGNFLRLLDLVAKGFPLPFYKVDNKRSFIYSKNLCSLILQCLKNDDAWGNTFVVSDGEDISTKELIEKIAFFMNKKAKMFPVPDFLLKKILVQSGKSNIYDSLFESLVVDASNISTTIGWESEINLDDGLKETVNWYSSR